MINFLSPFSSPSKTLPERLGKVAHGGDNGRCYNGRVPPQRTASRSPFASPRTLEDRAGSLSSQTKSVKDFTRKVSLLLGLNLFIGLTVNLEPRIYRLQQNTGGHLVAANTVFTSVLLLLYLLIF